MNTQYPEATKRFYVLYIIIGTFWISGGYSDMWAHAHIPELETFFTPWHALLYSGFFSLLCLFSITAYLNHRKGHPWKYSLPKEYHLSALGLVIFLVGGFGDMLWHTFLGIEKNFAIMISHPHMLIAVGGMMTTMGMLHSIWSRGRNPVHMTNWMVALIIAYVTLSFNYLLDYFNPFVFPYMMTSFVQSKLFVSQIGDIVITSQLSEILGIANIIFFTTFIMGVILISIRYWKAPFGTFTLVFTLNVLGVTLAYTRDYWFILTAFVAGLIIDVMYRFIVEGHSRRHLGLRIFGFLTPFVIFLSLAITIVLVDASMWAMPMWGGSILLASFLGYLLTYLLIPPVTTMSGDLVPKV